MCVRKRVERVERERARVSTFTGLGQIALPSPMLSPNSSLSPATTQPFIAIISLSIPAVVSSAPSVLRATAGRVGDAVTRLDKKGLVDKIGSVSARSETIWKTVETTVTYMFLFLYFQDLYIYIYI